MTGCATPKLNCHQSCATRNQVCTGESVGMAKGSSFGNYGNEFQVESAVCRFPASDNEQAIVYANRTEAEAEIASTKKKNFWTWVGVVGGILAVGAWDYSRQNR